MILVAAALGCVLSVVLLGGRLERLAELQFRWGWAAAGALALQFAVVTIAPTGAIGLHRLLHVASYVLAAACIIANRRIAGLWILALGAALNAVVIAANHGVMPASAQAMRIAGLPPAEHFANSAPLSQPHYLALGDVLPVPGPWPLGNVVSVGDILIIVGLFVVLHRACRAAQPNHSPLSSGQAQPG